jgi:nitronate monooxygenase
VRDAAVETAWIEALTPLFAAHDATPPTALREIYRSFAQDDDMLRLLVSAPPRVVSFHFGLPSADRIAALKSAGCLLLATATSPQEARVIEAAGIDIIVAQGFEAGGHRGMFDPRATDDQLGTLALTRLLVKQSRLPVIAAGGIMDGVGIRAALDLGAAAAQLGTAFIACPESAADPAHRAALLDPDARTQMTSAISGRPARCLTNDFSRWGEQTTATVPAYPVAYDAGKALNAAAKAKGKTGYGAKWAGQAARLARAMPAAELVRTLAAEMEAVSA